MRKYRRVLLATTVFLLLLSSCTRPELSAIMSGPRWDDAHWDAAVWSK